MLSRALIEKLVSAGRAGNFRTVEALPGAGNHAQVLRFSSSLRGEILEVFDAMTYQDRVAFVKALAVYENTVNGLGSVTALKQLLPLVQDDDHSLIDWVLSNTRSYWYYSHGAKSFSELFAIKSAHAQRRAESERQEAERERLAKARRAERATNKLFNAVRRGDLNAVQALLLQGAVVRTATPEGVPLDQYADSLGRTAIAKALRRAQGGASAA